MFTKPYRIRKDRDFSVKVRSLKSLEHMGFEPTAFLSKTLVK